MINRVLLFVVVLAIPALLSETTYENILDWMGRVQFLIFGGFTTAMRFVKASTQDCASARVAHLKRYSPSAPESENCGAPDLSMSAEFMPAKLTCSTNLLS